MNKIENANWGEFDSVVDPLDTFFESFDNDPELVSLDETSYEERAKKEIFKLELLDIDRYIKVNELKEITNPTFFVANGRPTSDGLLSNEIFGITQKDRAGTFAYIDLHEYFMDPSCYKTLLRLNRKFDYMIRGLNKFIITPDGDIEENPNGGTGILFLKSNFGKLKFKHTNSRARDMRIRYLEHNFKAGRMFVNKWVVIPAYYRDVNTSSKNTGHGEINTLYVRLITAAHSLQENNDYGMSMADTTCARIQDTLRAIYDWFCGNRNEGLEDGKGSGLSGKFGYMRQNLNYTADYSSRLVISAPPINAETIDDMMVNFDKTAVPLAAAAADFFPFMLFHMRKFFENEFLNVINYDVIDINGNQKTVQLDEPMMHFTDDILIENLKKFVYSHDTRFRPIELPVKDVEAGRVYYMQFKGQRWIDPKDAKEGVEPTFRRPLTWVDVIYIAAVKSTEGKIVSFTRYPYDSFFNTIYTGIEVASTYETEPLYVNGEYYRFYPKIKFDDINRPSATKFVDTLRMSNVYLDGLGADYDGDTGNIKGSFFKETNDELTAYVNSKSNFVNMGCSCIRNSTKEAVQALYNLTKVLSSDEAKLKPVEF